jgi:hypothetical protein
MRMRVPSDSSHWLQPNAQEPSLGGLTITPHHLTGVHLEAWQVRIAREILSGSEVFLHHMPRSRGHDQIKVFLDELSEQLERQLGRTT